MTTSELTSQRPRRRLRRPSVQDVIAAAAALLLIGAIAYPLIRTIAQAIFPQGTLDLGAFGTVAGAPYLGRMLGTTLLVVGVAAVFAILIASVFAWLNERTNAHLGLIGEVLPLLPLLVPSVAVAIGWTFLGAPQVGFFNGLLSGTLGAIGIDFQVNVYSIPGLIFAYTMEFIPYAYLVIATALKNVDPAIEEAARMAGASLVKTVFTVSLRAIAPAIAGAALLLAVVGFSMYSLPVILATPARIEILSVRIVQMLRFEYPPRVDEALVLSLFLMLAIGVTWWLQRRVVSAGRYSTIGGRGGGGAASRIDLGRWRFLARGGMILYLAVGAVLPILALFIVSLQPFWSATIDPSVFTFKHYSGLWAQHTPINALRNSGLLGLVGGAATVLIALAIAVFAQRHPGWIGRVIGGVTKVPAAIPTMVIAIGFLVAFSGPPFRLSGTVVILLLCYLVNFIPQASTIAEAAVAQVGGDLAEASAMSGATDGRTFRRIQLPLMLPGLANGWALIFVLIVGDIIISALLAGIGNPVVGSFILDIWDQGTYGTLAALASLVCVMTITVVAVMMRLSRPRYKRMR